MKYNFICIVILISCSVCASGDLKTYPGKLSDNNDCGVRSVTARIKIEFDIILYYIQENTAKFDAGSCRELKL